MKSVMTILISGLATVPSLAIPKRSSMNVSLRREVDHSYISLES